MSTYKFQTCKPSELTPGQTFKFSTDGLVYRRVIDGMTFNPAYLTPEFRVIEFSGSGEVYPLNEYSEMIPEIMVPDETTLSQLKPKTRFRFVKNYSNDPGGNTGCIAESNYALGPLYIMDWNPLLVLRVNQYPNEPVVRLNADGTDKLVPAGTEKK